MRRGVGEGGSNPTAQERGPERNFSREGKHSFGRNDRGRGGDGLTEVAAVIDLFNGLNKFNTGLNIEMDEQPWYGCGGGH